MNNNMILWMKTIFIFYLSICISGCHTPWLINTADKYKNRVNKFWEINDVTFAAIREQRFVRLCINLQRFSEMILTEVNIDLSNVDKQFQEQINRVVSIENQAKLKTQKVKEPSKNNISHENEGYISDDAINDEKSESVVYASCDNALRENEKLISIEYKRVEEDDLNEFINEINKHKTNELTIFLVEKAGKKYLVFGIPEEDFPDLSDHAIRCYGEDQRSNGTYLLYLLLPVTVALDAVLIVVGLFRVALCFIFFPCIIGEMAEGFDGGGGGPGWEKGFGPPPTAQPLCN